MDAASYTIELSKDSFRTILSSARVDTTYHLFENLKWEQLYQIQVKANAKDSSKNSKFSNLGAIKTPKFPTILNTPTTSEISDNAVRVSWANSGATVTDIKILKASDSSVVKNIALSNTDVTNQYRIVSGLSGSTDYIIFLYSGTSVRGWANFKTTAALAGNIIDLRDITGVPSILTDTLPDIPAGSIVLLKRGENYTVSGGSLGKTVTILSGTDLMVPDQAIINIAGNLDITAGSTIDSVVFRDVKLMPNDYTNNYVFNISQSCNISKLKFEGCRSELMRGFFRVKGGTVNIDNFIINNCVIDSVRDYGIINLDVATVKMNNVSVTNSTIYKAEKFIVSSKPTTGNGVTSLVVSNCSFNEVITGTATYIDFGSTNVANGITVSNCIFGVGKSGSTTIRDVKKGAATTVNASNNFRTSDYVSAGSANDLPNIVTYPKASIQLWQDPVNGNFKIIDSGFPGKTNAGDPRWR